MPNKSMKRIPLPAGIVSDILNASPDATIVSNADGQILVANQAAERLFGYDEDELIGLAVDILVPNEQRARHQALREAYRDAPRGRPMVSGLEIYGRHKDGHAFRAEVALSPIETDDGLVVTSTIRLASTANDSEAYFRHLLESAPDAMIIIDNNGKIAMVNAQAEIMFGYRRDEMLGQTVDMLLPERLRARHGSHRQKFMGEPQLRPMGEGLELLAMRAGPTASSPWKSA